MTLTLFDQEQEQRVPIKPYFKWELRVMYGERGRRLGEKQFNKWLLPFKDRIGERNGKYTLAQIEIIFECLGRPYIQ